MPDLELVPWPRGSTGRGTVTRRKALGVPVNAELGGQTVSANTSSQTVTIGYSTLTVVNDGSGSIYVRVFVEGETTAAATNAHREIKSGEGFTFNRALQIKAISILSASTSTVRLFYW